MSGHSKWSTIKRKKAVTDAKRSAAFGKLGRLIEVAARSGADPEMNFQLKLAIQKAKAANMPAANIDKAVRKGAGLDKEKSNIEEITYEGIGPGNVAVVVQALTDNKNRTVSEVRNIFTKNGGNFGTSVAWQFQNRGVIVVPKSSDDLELKLIDAGAEDIEDVSDAFEIYTDPKNLNQTKQNLISAGIDVKEDRLSMVPTNTVKISDVSMAKKIINFVESLEDQEDVTEVFVNFDIDDDILKNL